MHSELRRKLGLTNPSTPVILHSRKFASPRGVCLQMEANKPWPYPFGFHKPPPSSIISIRIYLFECPVPTHKFISQPPQLATPPLGLRAFRSDSDRKKLSQPRGFGWGLPTCLTWRGNQQKGTFLEGSWTSSQPF